jgi:hypothetical protein
MSDLDDAVQALARALVVAMRQAEAAKPGGAAAPASVEPASAAGDAQFLFEFAERSNDRLLDRIDGFDALFAALMAAVLAVVLLAIDRFRLIGVTPDVVLGWLTIGLLSGSFACCLAGLWKGNAFLQRRPHAKPLEERDGPHPGTLVWGVLDKGEEALSSATLDVIANWQSHLPIKNYKRDRLAWALLLLTLGTVSASAAKVVYSVYEAAAHPVAAAVGGRDGENVQHPGLRIRQAGLLPVRPKHRRLSHCQGRGQGKLSCRPSHTPSPRH